MITKFFMILLNRILIILLNVPKNLGEYPPFFPVDKNNPNIHIRVAWRLEP